MVPPASPPASAPAPRVARTTAHATRAGAPGPDALTAAQLLKFADKALADGNAVAAREWVRRALASRPTAHERAQADLYQAESLLVERRPLEAVRAFRDIAHANAGRPEGEHAAYMVGEVLFERGERADADAALRGYLARYPGGRFQREAEEKLAELTPSDE